jgi:hypothetical protein
VGAGLLGQQIQHVAKRFIAGVHCYARFQCAFCPDLCPSLSLNFMEHLSQGHVPHIQSDQLRVNAPKDPPNPARSNREQADQA